MFYSEHAVIHETGVRFPFGVLRRVGINPNSSCWGVWLQCWEDGQIGNNRDEAHPQHLAVCPFHPNDWPCLLHISLKLNDVPGTVHEATSALAKLDVNVLSHTFTPTGHNHGTLDSIGTVPVLRANSEFLRQWKANVPLHGHSTRSLKLQENLTRNWAQPMLELCRTIEEGIVQRHGEAPFLRPRFLPADESTHDKPIGLAFNPRFLPVALRELGKRQFLGAVSVRWLQYPAYFWFYSGTIAPIQMRTGSDGCDLSADSGTQSKFAQGLEHTFRHGEHVAPAIATIDPEAHIVRVMPYRPSGGVPHRVTVSHRYQAPSRSDTTRTEKGRACGLLEALTQQILVAGGNVWQMSNRIQGLDEQNDRSEISFIVTDGKKPTYSTPLFSKRLATALGSTNIATSLPSGVSTSEPEISPVTAKKIFVSKKNVTWEHKIGGVPVSHLLESELRRLGYEMDESPSLRGPQHEFFRQDVKNRIRSSQGVLQVMLKDSTSGKPLLGQQLQWIEFEAGIACGQDIPCEFALECDADSDLVDWAQSYQTIHGIQVTKWSQDDKGRGALLAAIQRLDLRIRSQETRT